LEKRGQGRFYNLKSPLFPLFLRGKLFKLPFFKKDPSLNSPLWKRGARGDFIF
jgi:hypothetical protein